MDWVKIHGWKENFDLNTHISTFKYWDSVRLMLVDTNIPIEYRQIIGMENRNYIRYDDTTIIRFFLPEEYEYTNLYPTDPHVPEDVILLLRRASKKGIVSVAKEIGMRIPFHTMIPQLFFEKNIKYYITGISNTDEELIEKLGYLCYYETRKQLLNLFSKDKPSWYYENGKYYCKGFEVTSVPEDEDDLKSYLKLAMMVNDNTYHDIIKVYAGKICE